MRPKIDFCISSNIYNISVTDLSDWNLIKEKPAIIEVTIPGFSKPITKYFDKNKVSVYHSINLDINCGEDPTKFDKLVLQDGIYTIKVIGSPSDYSKEHKYLKDDEIRLELQKIMLSSLEKNCFDKISDKYYKIKFLIEAANAYLAYDNVKMSIETFSQAEDMIQDLKDCKICGCR